MLLILRSKDFIKPSDTPADFTVRLPPHTRPAGAFTVQLVAAAILPTHADTVCVHCSLVTPGPHCYDTHTGGGSDLLAIVAPQVDSTAIAGPVIHCPGAGTWEEVRVQLKPVDSMAAPAVDHVVLAIEIDGAL